MGNTISIGPLLVTFINPQQATLRFNESLVPQIANVGWDLNWNKSWDGDTVPAIQ